MTELKAIIYLDMHTQFFRCFHPLIIGIRVWLTDEICSSLSVLQEDVLRQKKNVLKKTHICLYINEAKLSTFEWCWWLSIWEHNEIFCYYLLIFWQNISLCSQISAVSTIQLGLNLASLKYKQMWAFYQNICFSARKHPLETLLTRNTSRLAF